jgi:opacity protein-like surface antigen
MTNTKWLRRALLGSVALGVMASGAQADELSDLKAQLESLQSRVDQIEQQPALAALPEGASFLTLTRGSAQLPNYGTQAARDASNMPADRGFTIAVTPTADMPAPIAEVVVYGFVKGDVIYDFDKDLGDAFYVGGLWTSSGNGDDHIRLHARQSRFGIRSRTDTAIGQIRTQIEGDFFASSGSASVFRLRHAYGEWDITPRWTFLAGQTWRTAVLLPIGVSTVDFSSSAGPNGFPRAAQVRLTYHSGPISWAVAAEAPSHTSDAKWPNLSSYLQFDAPGGHTFIVTGTVADTRDTVFDNDDFGWAVQAGANINLADIATLTVGGLYGEGGQHCQYLAQDTPFCGSLLDIDKGGVDDFFSDKGWGVLAGLSFGITDTTTFNVQYGISVMDNDLEFIEDHNDVLVQTVHANILWRPVQQMQLGWEVMWGQYDIDSDDDFFVGKDKDDAIRAQFGAWFFF